MSYGFQFFRPDGTVLFDTQWPVLTLESKTPLGGHGYDVRMPARTLYNSSTLEAIQLSSPTSGFVYRFTTNTRTPTATRGFQFFSPDGRLIVGSEFPPMKVVGFRQVTEGDRGSQSIPIPAGKNYAIVELASVASGSAFNIVRSGNWWTYQWMNYAIRPVWSSGAITFDAVRWSNGHIYESESNIIHPVDRYLKYECIAVDVTNL